MSAGMIAQHAVVLIAVALSAAFVLLTRFPQTVRAARLVVAARLLRGAKPAWLQAFARRIAPRPVAVSGCGGCDGCGPAKPRGQGG